MVVETGDEVLLIAVKLGTLPLPPVTDKPIPVFELVQVKVAPVGLLLKLTEGIVAPEHTVVLTGTVATGRGLTVMV